MGGKQYLCSLSTTTITQSSKDLARLSGAKLKRDCGLRFQPGDGAAELQHRFGVVHDIALVNEVLQPVVRGLDLAGHVGEFEPNDRVVNELLAESAALVGVLDGFLVTDSGEADALDDDADALVVEVCHYHLYMS